LERKYEAEKRCRWQASEDDQTQQRISWKWVSWMQFESAERCGEICGKLRIGNCLKEKENVSRKIEPRCDENLIFKSVTEDKFHMSPIRSLSKCAQLTAARWQHSLSSCKKVKNCIMKNRSRDCLRLANEHFMMLTAVLSVTHADDHINVFSLSRFSARQHFSFT
jgi:hypothetical protein